MPRYTKEKKEHALSLMSPPQNLPVAEASRRTGISEPTLYGWRHQARSSGRAVPGDGHNAEDWKPEDKFAVVVETMGLSEVERAIPKRRRHDTRRWNEPDQVWLSKLEKEKRAALQSSLLHTPIC